MAFYKGGNFKQKANINNECFNCHEKWHYSWDYKFLNWKKKSSILRQYENHLSSKSSYLDFWSNVIANKVIEYQYSNNFDLKLFISIYALSALVVKELINIEIIKKSDIDLVLEFWYILRSL